MQGMAEPTPQAAEFGDRLTALHTAAGKPSFGEMSRTILMGTGGRVRVSDQQLGLYHKGRTNPSGVRVEVLIALCRFYDCDAADLGPVAAEEIEVLTSLTGSDEAFARTGWFGRTAVDRWIQDCLPLAV